MDTICGYRVIRRLSGGARSETLLAHDTEDRTVVLRILDVDYPEDTAAACIEALRRVEHDNLMPLIDFARLDDDRVLLVHPRVGGGSLGALLADGGRLEPGEVSCVVTAVAGAVSALHAGGWAHRRIDASAVLLSLGGDPVLAGFGHLEKLTGDGMMADLEAVRDVALGLLPRESETARRLEILESTPQLGEQIAAIIGRSATPKPVRLTRSSTPFDEVMSAAAERLVEPRQDRRAPTWITDLLAADGPVLELMDKMLASLRAVRRPVWLGAGGVFVALVAAAVLIPPTSGPAEAQTENVQVTNAVAPPDSSHTSETGTGSAGSETVETSVSAGEGHSEGGAIRSDDPLAATIALLAQRQRCLAAGSVDCLAGVVQDGSAAQSDAKAVLNDLATGQSLPGPIPFDDEAPLVQRTGGSAIVTGGSVSVLIVKGDDGWRLRDVFDAP